MLEGKGHIICLKGFCMGKNTSSVSNKEELISDLAFAGKDRVSKQLGKGKINLGLKSVTLGWMNFDSNNGRNVSHAFILACTPDLKVLNTSVRFDGF